MAESDADNPFKPGEDFYELPPDDPHYTHVGHIASAWARFEYEIDDVIWTYAAGHKESVACVTAQLVGVAPRFRALIAIAQLQDGVSKETIGALNRLMSAAQDLAAERNRIVHD